MNQLNFPILSLITFLPLLGAIILILIPRANEKLLKILALIFSLIEFFVSLALYFNFDSNYVGMQFIEKTEWIPALGMEYHLGIDGISLALILLTTFLTPLAILASWNAISKYTKEFYVLILLQETAILGNFVSLDLFLFYIFWEAMLLPMIILIGVWGGEKRVYAAVKFFIYTLAGSVLMLIGIIVLYFQYKNATGSLSFDILKLQELRLDANLQNLLFIAFALAFAVKVALFPLHTWLPDAYTEAPTAGTFLLSAILAKIGTYGFIRLCIPLFPSSVVEFGTLLSILAVTGIIYGAVMCLAQTDLKRLIAYSSISHLGFVVLGIFSFNIQGMQGAVMQMVNHGISTGVTFLIIGMLNERRNTNLISDFGGIWKVMPVLSSLFMIVVMSSLALPGTNGFVGEFLILVGAFQTNTRLAIIGAIGIIFGAGYLLWMFQRVIFLKIEKPENQNLKDANKRELAILIPVVLMIFWIGFYPKPFLSKFETSVNNLINHVKTHQTEIISKK